MLTWCGESSVLVDVTGCPAVTFTTPGPNEKPLMLTSCIPDFIATGPPGALPASWASEMTKSCFSCGLWQTKQFLIDAFAFSFGLPSCVKAAYCQSALRHSSGTEAPQP